MAYSDYGGYAYRNGERIVERSDAFIAPDGSVSGTPGQWPGWTQGLGVSPRHVILGDAAPFVGLYKQQSVSVYMNGAWVPLCNLVASELPSKAQSVYGEHVHINADYFIDRREPLIATINDCRLSVWWTEEDNYYQYARLEREGVTWAGFSGYGVGAGLENANYGYSTPERERVLFELIKG